MWVTILQHNCSGGRKGGEWMGVYLPGSRQPCQQDLPVSDGGLLCSWCGDPVDLTLPCVAPPSVQPIVLHPGCAAAMGEGLIADAREAMLAGGEREWSARAVALVRYRLTQQELG